MSSDAQSRDRWRLRLFVAGLVAGVLAICVIVAVSIVLVVHYFSNDTDPLGQLQQKYQHQYDVCRRNGGSDAACNETAADACINDPYFANDSELNSDISNVCLDFTAGS